jgi:hypothetical protein
MKTKFLIGAFAFLMALGFTACDDSSSADEKSSTQTPTQPGNGGNGGKGNTTSDNICDVVAEKGCTFKKEDNVWRFYYAGSSYVHIYTWVDDSTVEYKECRGNYHMDADDKTITDAVRDELFQQAMHECTFRVE